MRMHGIITVSSLTCPGCGHVETLEMPLDSCQFFYRCAGCGDTFRPKPGDCCVFCSYGSAPCPPVQASGACCAPAEPPSGDSTCG
jgi:hypothetical protein